MLFFWWSSGVRGTGAGASDRDDRERKFVAAVIRDGEQGDSGQTQKSLRGDRPAVCAALCGAENLTVGSPNLAVALCSRSPCSVPRPLCERVGPDMVATPPAPCHATSTPSTQPCSVHANRTTTLEDCKIHA